MIMVEYDRNHSHRATHYTQPREAAHLQHLDHHSAPSTPSPPYHYAQLPSSFGPQHQQPPTSVRSTPTSYPSPASYPSPSSMSAYPYPPQGGHNSPHYQPLSAPTYSLPPIRMTPPGTSLPPAISSQIGSPLPQHHGPPPLQYYHPHGHGLSAPPSVPHGHLTSSPLHQPLRYPLPHVPPERIMSGGRHKKEIKRRTKTGCLTCRKRRIKCDEAHPTCKNCAKSKRDCMGYDPIFKSQPGPAAIQPAPSSGGSIHQFQSSNPTLPYAVSNSSVGGSSYPQSAAGSSPRSSCEPYDYAPIIDPSLESSTPTPSTSAGVNLLAETSASYRPDLKRTIDRTSPFSCTSETPIASATPVLRTDTPNHTPLRDSSLAGHPAKRIKIDDLLSGGSNALPLTPPSNEHALSTEVFKNLYRSKYAPMMDDLLETGWFETRGVARIIRGGHFADMLSALFSRLRARGESYVEEEDSSLVNLGGDAGILLDCIHLMYGARPSVEGNRVQGRDDDHADASDIAKRDETAKRIAVLEALITGKSVSVNLSSPQSSPRGSPRQYEESHIGSSSKFWRSLARFVSLQEGRDYEIDQALEDMRRNITDNKKPSRETLYNIALSRHLHSKLTSPAIEKTEAAEDRRKFQSNFDKAKSVVVGTALSFDSESYLPRVCGRAVGIWAEPITEMTV